MCRGELELACFVFVVDFLYQSTGIDPLKLPRCIHVALGPEEGKINIKVKINGGWRRVSATPKFTILHQRCVDWWDTIAIVSINI